MRSIWIWMGPLALAACAQAPSQDERQVVYVACEDAQPTGSKLKSRVCWTADQKEIADRDVRTAKEQMERSRPAPIPVGAPGAR